MCELLKAREAHNDALQVQSLKEIKNTISQEATRFSGYQQHVIIYYFFIIMLSLKKIYSYQSRIFYKCDRILEFSSSIS